MRRQKTDGNVFSQYQVESPIATELRRLYNNIRGVTTRSEYKSFLVTSATRGEGKSTITTCLAITIAQFPQKKVLVVDADLRRPKVHRLFGLGNSEGLSDCLSYAIDPMKTIQKTELENLDVVTSGSPTDVPSALFESEHLAEFLSKVQFYYDIVLVDSAPVLAVSDTLFLCTGVDAVLLVVIAGVTPKQVAMRAKDVLVDAKANIAGVVVNNVSEALPYYYDYKYYGAYKDLKSGSTR
jgi:capsular exopolysaccharide synthesis family protein